METTLGTIHPSAENLIQPFFVQEQETLDGQCPDFHFHHFLDDCDVQDAGEQ